MNLDISDFEEIKIKGEELYKSFSEIYCPYLGNVVIFSFGALFLFGK